MVERRRQQRFLHQTDLRMHFDSFETVVETRTVDVGLLGLFVAMKQPPPVGTKVLFTLTIGSPGERIELEGLVVRLGEHRTRLGLSPPALVTGIGVALTRRPAMWESFVTELHRARARSPDDR